jgi:hypothetical protein
MCRLLGFALLGPLIGLVLMILVPAATDGEILPFITPLWLLLAPFAYFVGFFPALATGLIDSLFWRVPVAPRTLLATAGGFGTTVAYCWYRFDAHDIRGLAAMGTVGAVSALVCSLISRRTCCGPGRMRSQQERSSAT